GVDDWGRGGATAAGRAGTLESAALARAGRGSDVAYAGAVELAAGPGLRALAGARRAVALVDAARGRALAAGQARGARSVGHAAGAGPVQAGVAELRAPDRRVDAVAPDIVHALRRGKAAEIGLHPGLIEIRHNPKYRGRSRRGDGGEGRLA